VMIFRIKLDGGVGSGLVIFNAPLFCFIVAVNHRFEISNPKHQISNKSQIPNSNDLNFLQGHKLACYF